VCPTIISRGYFGQVLFGDEIKKGRAIADPASKSK
jgi:hypothetical protein